jgi:hypothetical protein
VSDVDTDAAPESSDELAPTAVAVLTHIVKSLVDDPRPSPSRSTTPVAVRR